MKIYIEKEKTFQINNNTKLVLLNVDEFVSTIKKGSSSIPAGHITVSLKYKLIYNNTEYIGESTFDSYKYISNNIDDKSPYKLELINWNLSDTEEKYLEFNFSENNIESNKKDENIVTSYVDMDYPQIKKLINDKIILLTNKLAGNINKNEQENPGYFFWNCKMILKNIYMACDKIINKFGNNIPEDEAKKYQCISEMLKKDETNWNSIENIENIFSKIKNQI